MVKYITSGTYTFLNECTLYIMILYLQQSLVKHMPLLKTVGENAAGSAALKHCSLCMCALCCKNS